MRVQLAALTLSRFLLNSALRMTYPFLPAIARGLGVTLGAVAQLVALRALVGFFSPLFSPLSERFGRRLILMGAMLLFSLGCLVVAVWPAYWALGLSMVAVGVAKVVYDPAMQSYLGDVVAYNQRGKALAVTEFAWAGALLVSAPIIGWIMARQGWHAPFVWLGMLGLGAMLLLWRLLPPGHVDHTRAATLPAMLQVLREHPVIWAVALYAFLALMANEILFIMYGDWMERSFGLSLTNLGLASGVIGGAEISGELLAGWTVDRFGKRPVVITTGLLACLLYVLMPYTSFNLTAALITLFGVFLAFELTFVGSMPLLTEVVPTARSVVLSVGLAAGSLGRMSGALVGPALWRQLGLTGNTVAGALLTLVAILILARWVRESTVIRYPVTGES
ncbi:MAG: MFS transporter [Chloroflexota bacterium]